MPQSKAKSIALMKIGSIQIPDNKRAITVQTGLSFLISQNFANPLAGKGDLATVILEKSNAAKK